MEPFLCQVKQSANGLFLRFKIFFLASVFGVAGDPIHPNATLREVFGIIEMFGGGISLQEKMLEAFANEVIPLSVPSQNQEHKTCIENILFVHKFFLSIPVRESEKKCEDFEQWCTTMDKSKDCCSETVQEKCPKLCDACPGERSKEFR